MRHGPSPGLARLVLTLLIIAEVGQAYVTSRSGWLVAGAIAATLAVLVRCVDRPRAPAESHYASHVLVETYRTHFAKKGRAPRAELRAFGSSLGLSLEDMTAVERDIAARSLHDERDRFR